MKNRLNLYVLGSLILGLLSIFVITGCSGNYTGPEIAKPTLNNGTVGVINDPVNTNGSINNDTIPTCPQELVNCVAGTVPQSYVSDDGCTKFKCVTPNDINISACVGEGKSYPVGTSPGSPIYSCCSGLVPYSAPGFTGGATCVVPGAVNISACVANNGACCVGDLCVRAFPTCVQDSAPVFLGCSDTCMPKYDCAPQKVIDTSVCVGEGKSYPVGTTPGSPVYTCCSGLVPYSPPGFTGGATCVVPGAVNTSVCVANNGACCIGDLCQTKLGECVQGFTSKFLGCDTSCSPKIDCVPQTKPVIIYG